IGAPAEKPAEAAKPAPEAKEAAKPASPFDKFATTTIPAQPGSKPPEEGKKSSDILEAPTVINAPAFNPPPMGAADGQETAPLSSFSFDFNAPPAKVDPQEDKITLEAPAIPDEESDKAKKDAGFSFQMPG